ncbi:PAP2-domain-containing protein [Clathrospora elynae]|uniref:PAP2-domain-containing protein n=1 Tax=Clathrospora elynae TaxID=706981 RepID=A0A6A5T8K4_9PLEO|nr:PAP2-domain-containing protein [Clathrospora elynae]
MGMFNNRNTTPVVASNTTATGTNGTYEKRGGMFGRKEPRAMPTGTASYNSRPSFGQWIKATWLDIVTMAIMGAIGLGVYMADPASSRSFPVVFQDGEIVYPQFAYPLRNEIIPIWAAALMAFFIPFLVFLIVQIRARSFWDVNNATIGLLYALIAAAVFQVFVKWLIGGLRPHFLAVCKPVIPQSLIPTVGGNDNGNDAGSGMGNVANGYRQIMFDRSICTGDQKQINDSLESMPSGHTTAAFAGFVFLYLYLNAKLKVFSNYHPAMWKIIVLYAPILGACLIGGALTIDEYHNWYDILAGAIIGTLMAFSAYRMVYASIWDFRFNHIPLLRHAPFVYGAGPSSFDGFHDALFTRKAGWGTHEGGSWGGAPFDAADGPRGTMEPHPDGPVQGHGHHESTSSRLQRKPVGASRHGEQMV